MLPTKDSVLHFIQLLSVLLVCDLFNALYYSQCHAHNAFGVYVVSCTCLPESCLTAEYR